MMLEVDQAMAIISSLVAELFDTCVKQCLALFGIQGDKFYTQTV